MTSILNYIIRYSRPGHFTSFFSIANAQYNLGSIQADRWWWYVLYIKHCAWYCGVYGDESDVGDVLKKFMV